MSAQRPVGDQPGEHGAAAREGIVDQQDALLSEMEDETGDDAAPADDTGRPGSSEPPS